MTHPEHLTQLRCLIQEQHWSNESNKQFLKETPDVSHPELAETPAPVGSQEVATPTNAHC